MSAYRRKKPNIRRPGVDRAQGFGGHYDPQPVTAPEAPQGGAVTASDQAAAPEATGRPESNGAAAMSPSVTPAASTKATAQRSPSEKRRADAEGRAASAPGPDQPKARKARAPAGGDRGPMKKVALTACPKTEQRAALDALTSELISIKDMVKLAGRRALARFEPTPEFEPVRVVPRMSSAHRYTTTKLVPAQVLAKLHGAVNPLGLKSDTEMLRGQYEPLFWAELDSIIAELQARKG